MARALADYGYAAQIIEMVAPVVQAFERGDEYAEAALSALVLSVLDKLRAGRLDPATADNIFVLLNAYLDEHRTAPSLSEEAQELLFEGLHFHHFGDPWSPNPQYLTTLATKILERTAGLPA